MLFVVGIDVGVFLLMYGYLVYMVVDLFLVFLLFEWYWIVREELGFEGVVVMDDFGMLLLLGDFVYVDLVVNGIVVVVVGNDLVLMVVGFDVGMVLWMVVGIVVVVEVGMFFVDCLEEVVVCVVMLWL